MNAVVLGVNGQDGSYLAEMLLMRGYHVTGLGRQPDSRYIPETSFFDYKCCDISDPLTLEATLESIQPEFIFHTAAIHGAAGFEYEPIAIQAHAVNFLSVQVVLEYLRRRRPDGHLSFASSAKVFATPLPVLVDEDSPTANNCLYAIAKNASRNLIDLYRRRYGISSSVFYLFQHESPRRNDAYFIPKICHALSEAKQNKRSRQSIVTLDFYGNWGAAPEFMSFFADAADNKYSGDFILASNKTWYAQDLVEQLFHRAGLDWRDHLEVSGGTLNTQVAFTVNLNRLNARFGRIPTVDGLQIAEEILAQVS